MDKPNNIRRRKITYSSTSKAWSVTIWHIDRKAPTGRAIDAELSGLVSFGAAKSAFETYCRERGLFFRA